MNGMGMYLSVLEKFSKQSMCVFLSIILVSGGAVVCKLVLVRAYFLSYTCEQ